ncbi:hypothetical protein B0H12DRAFT_1148836 [Mycena haematopus]|nr:hypothetical protein B0H12DRAFT_1148836 [Mycena haematopus]
MRSSYVRSSSFVIILCVTSPFTSLLSLSDALFCSMPLQLSTASLSVQCFPSMSLPSQWQYLTGSYLSHRWLNSPPSPFLPSIFFPRFSSWLSLHPHPQTPPSSPPISAHPPRHTSPLAYPLYRPSFPHTSLLFLFTSVSFQFFLDGCLYIAG